MKNRRLTVEQIGRLRDMMAFCAFAINSDAFTYEEVLGTLGHDVHGLTEKMYMFTPRTKNYDKYMRGQKLFKGRKPCK